MHHRRFGTALLMLAGFAANLYGDGLIYRYEGDVLPDEDAGFSCYFCCLPPCHESIEGGHLVLRWDTGGSWAEYEHEIASGFEQKPPTLWVEWRFRSNVLRHGRPYFPFGCDALFYVEYDCADQLVQLYGDAATTSYYETDPPWPLAINEFHTFRFESHDGFSYAITVDGSFLDGGYDDVCGYTEIRLSGFGGCSAAVLPVINEWDHIRYGTIGFGEKMIASDPPSGFVDLRHQSAPARFAVTFDQPNYVYIEDIAVEVTGVGTKPVVNAIWRRDQDGPETLEIVLDRPIPANATTRVILNDGEIINTVRYTTKLGDTDGDGDTDLTELAALQNCFSRATPDPACGALDFSDDGSVDLADVPTLVHALLTGPE